jgi:hypothetical protein
MSLTQRIDPIKTAIGVFVVLGLVLTAVAGYAILAPAGASLALPTISVGMAVSVLSSVSLVAFVVVVSKVFERQMTSRKH